MNITKINLNEIDSKETFLKLFCDHCATHHKIDYEGNNPFEFVKEICQIETLLGSFANTFNGYDNGSFDLVDLEEFYNSLYEFTQVDPVVETPKLTIVEVTQKNESNELELTITLSNGVSGTFDFSKVIPESKKISWHNATKDVNEVFVVSDDDLLIYPYIVAINRKEDWYDIRSYFKSFSVVELNDVLNEHQDSTLVIVTNYEDHSFSEAIESGEWEFSRVFLGGKTMLNHKDFEGDTLNLKLLGKEDLIDFTRLPSLDHGNTDISRRTKIIDISSAYPKPHVFKPLPELEELANFKLNAHINPNDFKPFPLVGDDESNETSYLLSSKANEEHLMVSIQQLKEGKIKEHSPQSVTRFLSMAPIPLLKKRSFLNSKRNIIILEFNMLLKEVQSNFMENSSDVDENVLIAWFEYFSSLVQAINSAPNLEEVRMVCTHERSFHYEGCTKVGNCGLVKNPKLLGPFNTPKFFTVVKEL